MWSMPKPYKLSLPADEIRRLGGSAVEFMADYYDGLRERRVMPDLLRIAKDLDIPLVGTNDLHYTHQHDASSHAALLCVQSGSTLDDPKRC